MLLYLAVFKQVSELMCLSHDHSNILVWSMPFWVFTSLPCFYFRSRLFVSSVLVCERVRVNFCLIFLNIMQITKCKIHIFNLFFYLRPHIISTMAEYNFYWKFNWFSKQKLFSSQLKKKWENSSYYNIYTLVLKKYTQETISSPVYIQ